MAKLFSGSGLQPGAIMDDSYVAVTIVSSEHQAYFGTAPMSGIRISEATDTSISKSLEGSFLVSAFGDIPVQIEINGLQAYWICRILSNEAAAFTRYGKKCFLQYGKRDSSARFGSGAYAGNYQ